MLILTKEGNFFVRDNFFISIMVSLYIEAKLDNE